MRERGITAPAWGVIVAVLLIAAAVAVPALTRWGVFAGSFPPLHATWDPRIGPGTIPTLTLAVLTIRFAADLARRLRWGVLLLVVVVASAAWMISLALVDGLGGIGTILDAKTEYLRTARIVVDIPGLLRDYIANIPVHSAHHWPVHVAGHPPGALLFFVGLVHLGLGSGLAAGFVVIAIAATTPAAVLITLKRLGALDEARIAAPFLVFGPAAIWMAVSADAVFGAVAAWGLCCLAIAATAKRPLAIVAWSLASGVLLGCCVMLSYGLPLLAVLAVAVLWAARSWRPLPGAAAAAAAVIVAFAVAGFAWWQAYPVLVARYWDGIAAVRPYGYWVWGDLAALAICAGPILGASIALAVPRLPRWRDPNLGSRVVTILTAAAALAVLLADLSGMSKAEVERIWLPFVPWLLLGTALLPPRWRRGALAAQLVLAIVVQHLLATRW
ncbi:MAG: hypothetical protein ABIP33_13310 [Pseudolysinimonas sp.]